MNKELFFEKTGACVDELADLLGLSARDVEDLLNDSGFFGPDLQAIKDRYNLTYADLCGIFLGID